MKECNTGRLQAYLDGALADGERHMLEHHLEECSECQRELVELRARRVTVKTHLSLLTPEEDELPDVEAALQRFHTTAEESMSAVQRLMRSIDMIKRTVLSNRWRPAMAGLMTLMALTVLFSFAPVRSAAAQILDVFRVRKFAIIPITSAKFEEIESLQGLVETMLGDPVFLREPGAPQNVADIAAASELAGYTVATPEYVPDDVQLTGISVETGPFMHFQAERDTLEALAAAAGVDDLPLPDTEIFSADLDFPSAVALEYRSSSPAQDSKEGTTWVRVLQMPSPSATLPGDLDVVQLGAIMLQWLGVPEADALRLAETIDWTSTLVIPFPSQFGRIREVDVDGVTGLVIQETYDEQTQDPVTVLLWQRDGMVYSIHGRRVDSSILLRVANSLSR